MVTAQMHSTTFSVRLLEKNLKHSPVVVVSSTTQLAVFTIDTYFDMIFLQKRDLINQIRDAQLEQIIETDYDIVDSLELAVKRECESYLTSRYDMTKVFPTINVYAAGAYAVSDYVYYKTSDETIYTCIVATSNEPPHSDWSVADPREAHLKMLFVDMLVYHLLTRVNPRQMSEVRTKRYDDAVEFLKYAASGEVESLYPLKAVDTNARIQYGSNDKHINFY